MAFESGFFNSKDGDRRYNARHFSRLFNGIINDGVFMSQGTQLRVTQGTNMILNVGAGRAWFNGTYLNNDAVATVTLEPGDLLLNRIDAIVIDVNEGDEVRETSVKVIKGDVASTPVRPTLIKSAYHNQYPLAYVSVVKNANAITTADITNMVGTSDTPFVTGILETMDIDGLIAQWGAEWAQWLVDNRDEFVDWEQQAKDDFDAWETLFKTTREEFQDDQELAFDTWFADIKDKLTSDVAGSLQVQIDGIDDRLEAIESNSVWMPEQGGTGLSSPEAGKFLRTNGVGAMELVSGFDISTLKLLESAFFNLSTSGTNRATISLNAQDNNYDRIYVDIVINNLTGYGKGGAAISPLDNSNYRTFNTPYRVGITDGATINNRLMRVIYHKFINNGYYAMDRDSNELFRTFLDDTMEFTASLGADNTSYSANGVATGIISVYGENLL